MLLQVAEERDRARHGKAPGEVAEASDGVGAPAARHVDACLADLGEHELGFETQRLLVLGVGGAEVAAAELEVAEQRGDGRAVEGDPVGGGVGGAHRASRTDGVTVQLPDVREPGVGGQAGVTVEELLEGRRRVVVVPELHLRVDGHRERVGVVGVACVDPHRRGRGRR